MTYRPRRPSWSTYHRNWRFAHIANSVYGSRAAKREGKDRIDNDGVRSRDFQWLNEHGAPSRFWFAKGDAAKHHDAGELQHRSRVIRTTVYPLRMAFEAFRDNANEGVGTEWEVKNLQPITKAQLRQMMADLAADARKAYGHNWQRRVVVKVLTDLPGGFEYAIEVCRAAHAHDIPTMLLPRGRDRLRTLKGRTAVTYVRGSLRRFPK